MRSKPRSVKPSAYPAIPFHSIRAVGFISTLVVGIILAVFIYNLHQGGFKLPWAFLVLLIAVILSLLNYVLTTITHCCYGLSPRLSLLSNTICLLLWLISLGLLSWSMSHTILTTCNATYWATSTGITVCRIYKALFAFTVLGNISYIAAIALDVIVRRRQTRLGEYDPMASNPALNDYKMHDRSSSVLSGGMGPYGGLEEQHPAFRSNNHADEVYNDIPAPGNYAGQTMPPPVYGASSTLEQHHGGEAQDYYQPTPTRPRVRFSAYGHDGYSHPSEQTHYDPAAYR
ncbi:hypothetical protein F9C07_2999 [Aspergillus flavus]|uniref:Uncharacterized protein n=7 Tax=Aspergillus subgen. Circumdati TaxID=2720871 RepID=B8N2D9_ASPFN|nr:unnamed protein product [Aspergillus oryzae RIB40]XP_041142676.1 uncharacterized protein G4B84_002962 [Aspergillus flavus NRRL3357]EIT73461.1 hypothetical protein Ao3042_10763 [Aspergillus oryzae 3.042]KAJ1708983.1 hypothetical protein NYO67_8834 [Aspergillus flavus]KDE78217.1 hypothetical protein AO1008_04389 [Aspergillus oryzae 100-8]OOO10682.1 hypothetical protein OAory_01064900 [Aspergillus oryzae]KAF7619883.1 hypothetical protein AFLA_001502 [Aspergillus flavus NRRL3357]|eukprot:EIT73461.1 hypothetical protein Ao3042_10763 [Aspergillus oryzae 3.042]